jgi:hypothetical protein
MPGKGNGSGNPFPYSLMKERYRQGLTAKLRGSLEPFTQDTHH